MTMTTSKPLTFGELEIGESFISFPVDGDDSGHGGFRKGFYVFKKINFLPSGTPDSDLNAQRLIDNIPSSHIPDEMRVLKIIL